jgi:hypothetical protein
MRPQSNWEGLAVRLAESVTRNIQLVTKETLLIWLRKDEVRAYIFPPSGSPMTSLLKYLGKEREIDMQVERVNSNSFTVNQLPDGSRIIVDSPSETVFALNATAGAAWDACSGRTTLSEVTEEMKRSFDPQVTEELAHAAIDQLREKKLVTTSGFSSRTTRREMIAGLGAVAVPLVVALTVGEQRAHALTTGSKVTTPPKPTPPCNLVCEIEKLL